MARLLSISERVMVLVYGRAQDEFVMVVNTPQCNKRNRVKSIIKNISFCGSVPKR